MCKKIFLAWKCSPLLLPENSFKGRVNLNLHVRMDVLKGIFPWNVNATIPAYNSFGRWTWNISIQPEKLTHQILRGVPRYHFTENQNWDSMCITKNWYILSYLHFFFLWKGKKNTYSSVTSCCGVAASSVRFKMFPPWVAEKYECH